MSLFQFGFLDISNHMAKLNAMGDDLQALDSLIKWEIFRPILNQVYEKERKSKAGAKPFDAVLMFKVLILQQNNNLSDNKTEFFIRDRFSYMRFLGIPIGGKIPDENTIWTFRERLKSLNLIEKLFNLFNDELARMGFEMKAGQMIDATFVEAPRQRNSREENAEIKEGKIPEKWSKKKRLHKDTDARWTKKTQPPPTGSRWVDVLAEAA